VRVFLDTNVLVAAFATRGLCADVVRLTLAAHEMVVSETVLAELARALGDKIGLPDREVRSVLSFVRQEATLAPAATPEIPVRDPADAPILSAALACGADVLVPGDRDLLELDQPVRIRIVSPRGFWQLVKGPADE
jgi:putative PIN family toxin of toxin-antitoxin system